MRPLVYAPYAETIDVPNVVVDGSANRSTLLALSHWPGTLCPDELRADLSAEMAFRYLDRGTDLHDGATVVTNNHFDEDGVVSVFALTDPTAAIAQRDFLVDVARAGDFGRFHDRDAARASMAIMALAERQTGDGYRAVLPVMAQLRRSLGDHRDLWAEEDEWLTETERALGDGRIVVRDDAPLDLAVVDVGSSMRPPHEMAVHNGTRCLRILTRHGSNLSLRYRYESWVLLQSRRPLPRVHLDGLAARLTELEPQGVQWSADPVDDLIPQLAPSGGHSDLDPAHFEAEARAWLLAAESTWSPYASEP